MGRIPLALSLLPALSLLAYYPGASLAQGPESLPPPLEVPSPTPPLFPKPPDRCPWKRAYPIPMGLLRGRVLVATVLGRRPTDVPSLQIVQQAYCTSG